MQNSEKNIYILQSYFDIYSEEKKFYKCNRYKKPTKYEIDYDFTCPEIGDNIVVIILFFVSFVFNLFLSSLV